MTGAGGYIGRRLVQSLVSDPRFEHARIALTDLEAPCVPEGAIARSIAADLSKDAERDEALADGADIVFHLAGVLGGDGGS